jgi:hypothetical protein
MIPISSSVYLKYIPFYLFLLGTIELKSQAETSWAGLVDTNSNTELYGGGDVDLSIGDTILVIGDAKLSICIIQNIGKVDYSGVGQNSLSYYLEVVPQKYSS